MDFVRECNRVLEEIDRIDRAGEHATRAVAVHCYVRQHERSSVA